MPSHLPHCGRCGHDQLVHVENFRCWCVLCDDWAELGTTDSYEKRDTHGGVLLGVPRSLLFFDPIYVIGLLSALYVFRWDPTFPVLLAFIYAIGFISTFCDVRWRVSRQLRVANSNHADLLAILITPMKLAAIAAVWPRYWQQLNDFPRLAVVLALFYGIGFVFGSQVMHSDVRVLVLLPFIYGIGVLFTFYFGRWFIRRQLQDGYISDRALLEREIEPAQLAANAVIWPVYWVVRAVQDETGRVCCLFAAVCLVAFMLAYWVVPWVLIGATF